MTYRFAKLENRHAGDRIDVSFNIPSSVYLMTPGNYERYHNGEKDFIRVAKTGTSNTIMTIPFDGDWFLVIEPTNMLIQLQANFEVRDVEGPEWINLDAAEIIVHNAPKTGDKHQFDKADYWEDQMGKKLPKTGFICPSCHEFVKREDIDGAHVIVSHITNSNLYFVPICQSCNRSRQDRDFIVSTSWLIEAPIE